MRWRSELVIAVTLVGGMLPLAAAAQAPGASQGCACFGKPGIPGLPSEPGGPDGPDGPGTPSGPPGTPPPSITIPGDESASSDRRWALLGAVGLVMLAGVPFGGDAVSGLPFVPGGGVPAALPEAAQLPPTEPVITRPGSVGDPLLPEETAGAPAGAPAVGGAARDTMPAVETDSAAAAPAAAATGLVPPKTATHLPLLGALGVLMTGGGALLARRTNRERRRRKRLVVR